MEAFIRKWAADTVKPEDFYSRFEEEWKTSENTRQAKRIGTGKSKLGESYQGLCTCVPPSLRRKGCCRPLGRE